jgi:Domain of Unknown Function (DUF1259)
MRSISIVLCTVLLAYGAAAQKKADWSQVESALGRPGKMDSGVYKLTFPRTDLHVRIGNTSVEPAAALTSWMAFRQDSGGAVVVGDLALLEAEVTPVVSTLALNGVETSAIHNHLMQERPRIMFVHFFGRGELGKLATALKNALAQTKTPRAPLASEAKPPYDTKAIEAILEKTGTVNGTVLGFSFPREHRISTHSVALPAAMGMATAINFQPSPGGVAATGDFVLREAEVDPVIGTLRAGGVSITAVHTHLLDAEPRTMFLHFWAEGTPEMVAKALKAALEQAK